MGKISFTKFTSPEGTMQKLATIVPGQTTAEQVEQILNSDVAEGSTPAPLWNDLVDYAPPLEGARTPAGGQIAIDNELLRAARDSRDYQYVLFWAALNLADTRLDQITRRTLTDPDGRFDVAMISRQALGEALASYPDDDFPKDGKAVTNILSLLERCQLIIPDKRGGSIVGVEQLLPTRRAAPSLVRLVTERLTQQGIAPATGGEVDLALAIGANAWLGLSRKEFLDALQPKDHGLQQKAQRGQLPDDLTELAAQLRRKRQVVLQGPPGAGKTYVARKYVEWASAHRTDESRLQSIIDSLPVNERTIDGIAAEISRRGLTAVWDIVQFHPGYDYTDFVRALVAEPHANGVTFTPTHKLFSLLAGIGRAIQAQGTPVDLVLILDEINRGDIPNIFGELLYALEYRNEAVSTPYTIDGDASITVPDNLFLIGTMNTADRSIAVIDYALRRRFVFLDIAATDQPIQGYPFDSEITRAAALHLAELTRQTLASAPSGLKVGPSYFLAEPEGADSSLQVLASRYIYEVLPLLTEYEMEGEIDSSALLSLRTQLGVSGDVAQKEQAELLAGYLQGAVHDNDSVEQADTSAIADGYLDDSEDTGGGSM
ncbi:McrB family protein [Mycolicibacterium porcinum]|uniref:AAA family ATPase n=1 Tax=Mycolicibacterium porcinum TaxID=39693 RepID=A0ABV3VRI5_9MYCO